MRGIIMDALFAAMKADERVFFLTADMGINLVERFAESYPSRFLNVGIAEQNLIGISAGLCNLGYRPFAYTISNFLVHRPYEQIRNDVALHGYPVTLLGTSGGFDNAPLGPTHHVVDELGALGALAGIDLYCPSSTNCARELVGRLIERERPAYVRMPKDNFDHPALEGETAYLPGSGRQTLIIGYGATAPACIAVQETNPAVSVLICQRLRPLDEEVVAGALARHDQAIVVEDHLAASGVYGALCRLAMEYQIRCRVRSLAPDNYSLQVGASPRFYQARYRLDKGGIEEMICQP
ncbi:MAG: hypothetical protein FJW20_19250 [Acidimicrobiia bacterium]|nr:hypothetical protein [Acidimicrobiia bacterium]